MPDHERAEAVAALDAVRALMIACIETAQIDSEVLRSVLEDAAAAQRNQAAESGEEAIRERAARLLEDLIRDTYAAKP